MNNKLHVKGIVMKRLNVVLFMIVAPVLCADYAITYLGSLSESFTMSRPLGINERGQVVGWSRNASNQYRAFLWDSTNGIQDIGDLGGGISIATGINDSVQIVGSSRDSSGQFRPFIWDNIDGMQSFSDISGHSFIGVKINNSGQIAGGLYDASGRSQAFYIAPMEHNFLEILTRIHCTLNIAKAKPQRSITTAKSSAGRMTHQTTIAPFYGTE